MSAHTPGPWQWDWHPDKPDCVIALHDTAYAEADVLLCTGDSTRAWGEISAADARLIAAAPDLLEALKAVVDLSGVGHEDPDCPEDDTCRCPTPMMVNAAIAKAEGRAAGPSRQG